MWYNRLLGLMSILVLANASAAGSEASSSSASSSSASSCNNIGNNNNDDIIQYYPQTFTPSETASIIHQMKEYRPVEHDDRPDKSVKRTNYFDQGDNVTKQDSPYRWIFEKIAPMYYKQFRNTAADEPPSVVDDFVANIDFILLHEFRGGDSDNGNNNGFFDWHVDVQPNDSTDRTTNINIMLSKKGDYQGGALTVGLTTIPAQQGDLYFYPASHPHKVDDITQGTRHTFIIAMKEKDDSKSNDKSSSRRRQEYWKMAEQHHQTLCASKPMESKLHLLYGEFLAALGRPNAEVDAKFADMYASTPEAEQYAHHFQLQGEQAVQQQSQGGKESSNTNGHLLMAQMIRDRVNKRRSGSPGATTTTE